MAKMLLVSEAMQTNGWLRIVEVDDGGASECSIASFLSSNEEDEETCEAVLALLIGQATQLGGGACPAVDVTRVR